MKIWYQHGSEHSANLVMIGHFEDATEAAKVKEIIDALTEQVAKDQQSGALGSASRRERYGQEMCKLLMHLDVSAIGPSELEQFLYDVNIELNGNSIVVTTDEYDIAAFLKVLVLRGARVEVYSAHDHPDTAHGRGK